MPNMLRKWALLLLEGECWDMRVDQTIRHEPVIENIIGDILSWRTSWDYKEHDPLTPMEKHIYSLQYWKYITIQVSRHPHSISSCVHVLSPPETFSCQHREGIKGDLGKRGGYI